MELSERQARLSKRREFESRLRNEAEQRSRRMEAWAASNGLRRVKTPRCLHWLAKKRCGDYQCVDRLGFADWRDHSSAWVSKGNGERVIVCQPYGTGHLWEAVATADRLGLTMKTGDHGWHHPATILIEMRKAK